MTLGSRTKADNSVTGKKAYQCLDDYETYEIGSVIEPWTFIQDRIGYYTEGNPLVTNERPFNGTKSVSIKKGKIELMFGNRHSFRAPPFEQVFSLGYKIKYCLGISGKRPFECQVCHFLLISVEERFPVDQGLPARIRGGSSSMR